MYCVNILTLCLVCQVGCQPRIVGGRNCSVEDFPFMVAIHFSSDYEFRGSGTLVQSRWVLTAAHCVSSWIYSPHLMLLTSGLSRISREGVQQSVGQKVYLHPNYTRQHLRHDISLIYTANEFFPTDIVAFVHLPFGLNLGEKEIRDVCSVGTVIGWGETERQDPKQPRFSSNQRQYRELMCVNLPVESNSRCEELMKTYRPFDAATQFCSLDKEGRRDACHGDSGGPLVCHGYQFGIVSGGRGCACPSYPGFYTRVDRYESFIKDMIRFLFIPLVCCVSNISDDQSERIIGGYDCSVEAYPFLVAMLWLSNMNHHCGGTIVGERWALTAGHCVARFVSHEHLFVLVAGLSQVSRDEMQVLNVEAVMVHPEFSWMYLHNDIGLIYTDRAFRKSSVVQFVILNPAMDLIGKEVIDVCDAGLVMGWGSHLPQARSFSTSALGTVKLQCVELAVLANRKCSSLMRGYSIFDPESQMCSFGDTRDACKGDSGGPLMCNGRQYGIISGGRGCANGADPGFYTRVDKFEDFITATMNGASRHFLTSLLIYHLFIVYCSRLILSE